MSVSTHPPITKLVTQQALAQLEIRTQPFHRLSQQRLNLLQQRGLVVP